MDGEQAPASAGDLLRRARRQADLSQRELAQRSGLPRRTIERIEAGGTRRPALATMTALLSAAGALLLLAELGAPAAIDRRRDRAGRRYPAHLDVRVVDAFGSWWGDWPLLSCMAPVIWHRAARRRPAYTFDLSRRTRDERRQRPVGAWPRYRLLRPGWAPVTREGRSSMSSLQAPVSRTAAESQRGVGRSDARAP